jgi:hypothetical protein
MPPGVEIAAITPKILIREIHFGNEFIARNPLSAPAPVMPHPIGLRISSPQNPPRNRQFRLKGFRIGSCSKAAFRRFHTHAKSSRIKDGSPARDQSRCFSWVGAGLQNGSDRQLDLVRFLLPLDAVGFGKGDTRPAMHWWHFCRFVRSPVGFSGRRIRLMGDGERPDTPVKDPTGRTATLRWEDIFALSS